MRKSVFAMACVLAIMVAAAAFAGSLDQAASPTSAGGGAMYTLENIYQRLLNGTTATKRVGPFAEPLAGPTATGHTLDDVYNLIGTRAFVPKSGQTGCWDAGGTSVVCTGTGQDGDKLKGVASPSPRFTDNSNGTVTDNLTGLIWLKNANCATVSPKTWANALTNCNSLASGVCGLTDGSTAGQWRLPNVKELQSLIDFQNVNPALPTGHPFSNVQAGYYWSATTKAFAPFYAWVVHLSVGYVDSIGKPSSYSVWPVRGGQ